MYVLLLVLLVVYINKQSEYFENQKDSDFEKYYYDSPDPYKVLDTEKVKPIYIDGNSDKVDGLNLNELNIYSTKYWTVKNKGFSDIYNYEDNASKTIYNFASGTTVSDSVDKKDKEQVDEKSVNGIPLNINYKDINYKLLGIAFNPYFKQYYYIFEQKVETNIKNVLINEELEYIKNNQIYSYLLVKMHNNKPIVVNWVGPRNKINIDDVVYLALGSFQLGPLSIKSIKV